MQSSASDSATSVSLDTDILGRFKALKEARSFTFRPPSGKERLGEIAFGPLEDILIHLAAAILVEVSVHIYHSIRGPHAKKDETPQDIFDQIRSGSAAIKHGLRELEAQGVHPEDALAAIQLLEEAIALQIAAVSTRLILAEPNYGDGPCHLCGCSSYHDDGTGHCSGDGTNSCGHQALDHHK